VRLGLALLDEAMVAGVAGEVWPPVAGNIYCSTIDACQEISDLLPVWVSRRAIPATAGMTVEVWSRGRRHTPVHTGAREDRLRSHQRSAKPRSQQ
jgi:hypothetical protein